MNKKKQKKNQSSGYVLAKTHSPPAHSSALVAVGSDIYNIGGDMYHGKFEWFDTNVRLWRTLEGVEELPKVVRKSARLADYGGKMAVLWDQLVPSSGDGNKMIWCAVIALETRNSYSGNIWGKVERHDAVLLVPKSCRVECALAATV